KHRGEPDITLLVLFNNRTHLICGLGKSHRLQLLTHGLQLDGVMFIVLEHVIQQRYRFVRARVSGGMRMLMAMPAAFMLVVVSAAMIVMSFVHNIVSFS